MQRDQHWYDSYILEEWNGVYMCIVSPYYQPKTSQLSAFFCKNYGQDYQYRRTQDQDHLAHRWLIFRRQEGGRHRAQYERRDVAPECRFTPCWVIQQRGLSAYPPLPSIRRETASPKLRDTRTCDGGVGGGFGVDVVPPTTSPSGE